MMNKRILGQTDAYYTEKINKFGDSHWGVDWNSEESQRLRFDQLSCIIREQEGAHFSLCDYGCGYGSYAQYLSEKLFNCAYTGLDVSEAMVAAAKKHCGVSEKLRFIQSAELTQSYDYIVASGIFNVRQSVSYEEWTQYILDILNQINQHAQKGFVFNCLTKYSDADYMRDYLYYADPLYLFDYCKCNFSRNVSLLHDYDLYEFTILVRKVL